MDLSKIKIICKGKKGSANKVKTSGGGRV